MRYTFLTVVLLVLFFPPSLFSQYDDLLRDSDISWLAEYTADYELNPVYHDNLDEEYNFLSLYRMEHPGAVNDLLPDTEVSHWMSALVLNGLANNIFECYADEHLRRPVSQDQLQRLLSRRDTTPSIEHPGEVTISVNEVQAADIVLFRVRQVLFYNTSKRKLDVRLLALAPVVAQYDEEGNAIGYKPLVWVKIPALSGKAAKKLAKEASYVVQTRMKENAPLMNELNTVKGSFDPRQWAYGETTRPAHQNLAYDTYRPLKPADLHTLIFTNDTIVRFNDAGQTEIERVVQNDATRRVEKIRLVQNWYIDERRGLIGCRVVAAAPLAAVRDPEGNFRYYKPLFYVKY